MFSVSRMKHFKHSHPLRAVSRSPWRCVKHRQKNDHYMLSLLPPRWTKPFITSPIRLNASNSSSNRPYSFSNILYEKQVCNWTLRIKSWTIFPYDAGCDVLFGLIPQCDHAAVIDWTPRRWHAPLSRRAGRDQCNTILLASVGLLQFAHYRESQARTLTCSFVR